MLITKEQQEAWVNAYVKEKHTQDECIGFIDGVNKALDVVKNNLAKSDVNDSLPSVGSGVTLTSDKHIIHALITKIEERQ